MIPETSTTLLRNVRDADHSRWPEFVAKYRPMMEAYLKAHFPTLEADDVIQETFAALCGILPGYIYDPDEKGHFRNYLTGILRNKALRQFGANRRYAEIAEKVREGVSSDGRAGTPRTPLGTMSDEEQSWRETLVEIALRQLMNDETIQSRTRQVFLRVAVNGEKPDDVAAAFGINRNAVDQIKNRMMPRLQKIVADLEKAGNI